MKTLVGLATFGGADFTKLALNAIWETTKNPVNIFVVVGKPDDYETLELVKYYNIPHIIHEANHGFPAAVNDIYEYGWVKNDYDNIIIMGNDVLPYPYAIDSMINLAAETDYELICANEFDVRALCARYEEAKTFFEGPDYIFKNFDTRPWDLFTEYSPEYQIGDASIANVQNLCLYKRSVFEKIGYTDANFYPAYYIDNDYARRAVNAELKACTLMNAIYFHFWSRTIKQGSGGSTHKFFENNRAFYIVKWGGDFAKEAWKVPFNGYYYVLENGTILKGSLKIDDNSDDYEIAKYWRNKA